MWGTDQASHVRAARKQGAKKTRTRGGAVKKGQGRVEDQSARSPFVRSSLSHRPRCPMSPSAMQELPFPSCIRRFSPRTFASLRFAICPATHAFLHVYRNQALAHVAMHIHLQLAPIMRATQGHPHVEQTSCSWRTYTE